MGLSHNQTIIARLREHFTAGAAPMNGHEFADPVAPPYARFRWFAFVLQILRGKTNRNERKNMRTCADSCLAIHDAVRLQTNAVAQLNLIADYRIRTDVAIAAKVRAAADNSRRVNGSGMSGCSQELRNGGNR